MAQHDIPNLLQTDPDGPDFAALLDAFFLAQKSGHSGVSRPDYALEGLVWSQVDGGTKKAFFYDGDTDRELAFREDHLRLDGGTMTGDLLLPNNGIHLGGSGAANFLNDYEEGTWTPEVKGSNVAGSGVYSGRVGSYRKVGSLVHLHFGYGLSSHTGSGYFEIAGLPFAPGGPLNQEFTGTVMLHGYNTTSGRYQFNLYTAESLTTLRLYGTGDSLSWEWQPLDGSHYFVGQISYYVD